MHLRPHTPILRCEDCGSSLVELRGPVTDNSLVRCAECGAEAGRWPAFLSDLETRIEKREQEHRRRRLH
jgi:DNA-directed RNA polymerase subunit RPC12/RpoP